VQSSPLVSLFAAAARIARQRLAGLPRRLAVVAERRADPDRERAAMPAAAGPQPPDHWVALVRDRAPDLLEPGTVVRPAPPTQPPGDSIPPEDGLGPDGRTDRSNTDASTGPASTAASTGRAPVETPERNTAPGPVGPQIRLRASETPSNAVDAPTTTSPMAARPVIKPPWPASTSADAGLPTPAMPDPAVPAAAVPENAMPDAAMLDTATPGSSTPALDGAPPWRPENERHVGPARPRPLIDQHPSAHRLASRDGAASAAPDEQIGGQAGPGPLTQPSEPSWGTEPPARPRVRLGAAQPSNQPTDRTWPESDAFRPSPTGERGRTVAGPGNTAAMELTEPWSAVSPDRGRPATVAPVEPHQPPPPLPHPRSAPITAPQPTTDSHNPAVPAALEGSRRWLQLPAPLPPLVPAVGWADRRRREHEEA
jgi:hypothetical protein